MDANNAAARALIAALQKQLLSDPPKGAMTQIELGKHFGVSNQKIISLAKAAKIKTGIFRGVNGHPVRYYWK